VKIVNTNVGFVKKKTKNTFVKNVVIRDGGLTPLVDYMTQKKKIQQNNMNKEAI